MRNSPFTLSKFRSHRAGFTLVELMIVVTLLGLISAIAMPNLMRARKRAQASKILDDLRMIDSAIEQYSTENPKTDGRDLAWTDITPFFKSTTKLASSDGRDLLGNPYVGLTSGEMPSISDETADALADVAPPGFWSPYR